MAQSPPAGARQWAPCFALTARYRGHRRVMRAPLLRGEPPPAPLPPYLLPRKRYGRQPQKQQRRRPVVVDSSPSDGLVSSSYSGGTGCGGSGRRRCERAVGEKGNGRPAGYSGTDDGVGQLVIVVALVVRGVVNNRSGSGCGAGLGVLLPRPMAFVWRRWQSGARRGSLDRRATGGPHESPAPEVGRTCRVVHAPPSLLATQRSCAS